MHSGRHFLQIPGPTNVPDRVLRAMDRQTIDHRGPEFAALGKRVLSGMKPIFKTSGRVFIYPASGTGAWEAALVNTLSHGDKLLMSETGHFATLWHDMAVSLGLDVEFVPTDWRRGVDPDVIEAKLTEDRSQVIKAVAVVTSDGRSRGGENDATCEPSSRRTQNAGTTAILRRMAIAAAPEGVFARRPKKGTQTLSTRMSWSISMERK